MEASAQEGEVHPSACSELQLLKQRGHLDARSSLQRFTPSCQVVRMSRDATTDTATRNPPCREIRIGFSLPRHGSFNHQHRSHHSTCRNSTWTLIFATTTTAGTADPSVDSICSRNVHWWFAAEPRRDHTTTESGSPDVSSDAKKRTHRHWQ